MKTLNNTNQDICYIEYLNAKKGFRMDHVKFTGEKSIRLAKDMVEFYPLEKALDNAQANILRGQSLSDSLKAEAFFDNKMIALVRVAEETNQTAFVFGRLNEQYGKELIQRSKLFSTTLEPAIILIVGILVATILVAMYLPMFALANVLH